MGLVTLSILPCLLIGAFNPFTFKVIIDRYALIAILLIFFLVVFVAPLCSFLPLLNFSPVV